MELRECQTKAISVIQERRKQNEKETNISMCTGAGKSNVIQEITGNKERRILVFPWLDLLRQYYKKYKCDGVEYLYFCTEGTLPDVPRLSENMEILQNDSYLILTTYSSVPQIYSMIPAGCEIDLLIHDEAHNKERAEYKESYEKIRSKIRHTVNLSATLPLSCISHYKYSLLRGQKDKVVRDFNMELFMCVKKERNNVALLLKMIEKLKSLHKELKILVYTAEANTENDDTSSVKTFMSSYAEALRDAGVWIKGINADTKDREKLLVDFEKHRSISILVSCKTLTEGIDLKNVNCMIPWDPSSSTTVNIQRIGRCVRLLKENDDSFKKEQTPSTILIPIFLDEEKYKECNGDREAINALLSAEISKGERGNFRPIINVCTALKEELAEDDPELFNQLLGSRHSPKVAVNRDMVECVAKHCKKTKEDLLEEVEDLLDEDELEDFWEEEWSENITGRVADAIANTQNITLIINDGDESERYGTNENIVTLEKKNGESYKSVKAKKKDVQARIRQRINLNISEGCTILLGIDSIEGADATCGMVLTRLTSEVKLDEDWNKRLLEWIAQYKKCGGNPSRRSMDLDEKKAGIWQHNQRQCKKKGIMSKERIAILEATEGWKWEDDTWEPNRQHWIAQYKKCGKKPSETSKDPDEKKAGQWQGQQRDKKKKGVMSKERIDILEETEGWKWEGDDTWEPNRQHWIAQYKKCGKNLNTKSKDPDEKKAGSWQSHQRKYKKKGVISKERIDILEATKGWKWEEDTWEPNRQHWIAQYKKCGKKPSMESKDLDEKKAGSWQSNQRTAKKKGVISKERIDILEKTEGWEWEEETWEPNRQHWIAQYKKCGRYPSQTSEDPDEKKAGQWQGQQRDRKKKGEISKERIDILEATEGWKWEEDDTWEPNRQHWIAQYKKRGGNLNTRSNDLDEKKAGSWQSNQRKNKKKGIMSKERIDILEATEGWLWSSKAKKNEIESSSSIDIIPPVVKKPATRTRKPIKLLEKVESKETGEQRKLSELEKYHQRFKKMNASTYKENITNEEFTKYHTIADTYDARDPTERQPIFKIATLLKKYNKQSYNAIDLGCGKNRLRNQECVNKMKWTSVDVIAIDNDVVIADMSNLPYEDESYDFAILSRSLWARNHMDVLQEVFRILKIGGHAIVCESFRRWLSDTHENTLLSALHEIGFEMIREEGTSVNDKDADVFQYITVRKV